MALQQVSLADRVPPRPGSLPETLLELLLSHFRSQGLSLYSAQEQAILELLTGSNVILATPTGSGKSLVARPATTSASCLEATGMDRTRTEGPKDAATSAVSSLQPLATTMMSKSPGCAVGMS